MATVFMSRYKTNVVLYLMFASRSRNITLGESSNSSSDERLKNQSTREAMIPQWKAKVMTAWCLHHLVLFPRHMKDSTFGIIGKRRKLLWEVKVGRLFIIPSWINKTNIAGSHFCGSLCFSFKRKCSWLLQHQLILMSFPKGACVVI